MEARGLTIEALADMAGLDAETIKRARVDIVRSRRGTLDAIADALGCTIPDLFERPAA